jgi:hypothetical protein
MTNPAPGNRRSPCYRGQTRVHTASDLTSYLRWRLAHGLAPLQAQRTHIELYLRWMQEVRRFKPSTVSWRLSASAQHPLYAAVRSRGEA